ncbi:MAG TPA: molybdopterin-dependent oxidoreductase, partial [Bryobacteraceae bacterium]|nr:molybdopterin-dependent oxidoreductase [Bryobacteraceae bacterium]
AAQDVTAPLFIATPYATRLEDVATAIFHAAPDSVARLGFAVAHELDPAAPPSGNFPDAAKIAQTLKNAKRPLVISGAGCGSEAVIRAAANVAKAAGAALLLIAPECNSVGAALMGGGLLTRAFELVSAGKADTAVVLENDLYRRAPASEVDALLTEAANVIVLDSLSNRTTARANLLLPAGTFAESDGTLVSSEGRAQRFLQVFVPPGEIQESWRWLDIFNRSWPEFDDVLAAISAEFPELARARDAAPSAAFRMAGAKIPRGPHRYSGRTAMTANIAVSEPKPPDDPDTPLSFSMEGTEDHPPPPVIPFFWTAGWNSIQATNFYQREVGGPLRGGVSGVRLFEPGSANGHTYFAEIPLRFEPREGEWLIVPIHHIFGSEELSLAAPGIARLAPEAYVAVGGSDFANGSEVELRVAGQSLRLPVQALSGLPRGVAGLPLGVPPLTGISLPAWGSIASVA